jgi:hypothetical protein
VNCFANFVFMVSFCFVFSWFWVMGKINSSWFCFVLLGYCIGSNFWKFYLIRIHFTLGEPVQMRMDLFGCSRVWTECTTSYLLAGPACLWWGLVFSSLSHIVVIKNKTRENTKKWKFMYFTMVFSSYTPCKHYFQSIKINNNTWVSTITLEKTKKK